MKKTTGFTLIETIIYAAILAIILEISAISFLILSRSFLNIRLVSRINAAAETAIERMAREIRQANDFDQSASPGVLKLKTVNSSGAPTIITFFLDGVRLMIQEGSSTPENLTSFEIETSRLVFYQINTLKSKAIKTEIEMAGKKFYETIVLRGSY